MVSGLRLLWFEEMKKWRVSTECTQYYSNIIITYNNSLKLTSAMNKITKGIVKYFCIHLEIITCWRTVWLFIKLLNVMHICRPIVKFAFDLFVAFLCCFFSLRICKLTILEYVAVYSWSLQSTLTGIPLPENSNRVAIQFGASTWVDSMKPTEAKLYHSLGDGGNEWKLLYLYKSTDTWHRCSPIQANKGQSK